MRLLHLTDRITRRGGAHRYLQAVALRLDSAGHDVHVAAGSDDGSGVSGTAHLVPGLEAREALAVDLDALANAIRPDVLHLHTIVNPSVLEWAADRPALITVQDHRYFCPGRGKWTGDGGVCRNVLSDAACAGCLESRDYMREALALTRRRLEATRRLRVVTLSHYMKRELVDAGVTRDAITVIPPFVHDLDPTASPDGPPCVLFVGRLCEHKGVGEAIAAWRRSGVGLPLVMAGTGPWREKAERLGATVLGWLDVGYLSSAFRRARALVMPSRWQEPFGIAGLEALAMGVPVVGWDSGGVSEWHPGPGLVPWGDVDALARALRVAVEGPRGCSPAGHDPDHLMGQLVDLYREVIGDRTAPAGSGRRP